MACLGQGKANPVRWVMQTSNQGLAGVRCRRIPAIVRPAGLEEAMRKIRLVTAATTLSAVVASYTGAHAAEIAVVAAAAVQEPFEAVAHAYERESGDKVHASFGSVGQIQTKLKAGEKADLVISSTPAVAAAEKEGAVRPGSRAVLGRVEIGVAVREGAPMPDISTTDAFKRTLMAAKSVSFTDPAGGGTAAVFVAGLFDRLAMTDAIKKKAL